ncbi:hypothetical protein TWF102_011232 [Orbilia oligospora]|uniref:Uncharacterized protein n=1 Tax=Orbilia oligospora TaxID=2813651 RepID=A0A7C8N6K7_ORBOL|nr:hypothetical protein TWF102_011232 [Orbilia oligospora]KAF3098799.1 hypothetical protein TWF103_008949 [Orbilia oligospora]KAF3129398.1 hypothetical protein TWF594_011013 [Orbilia oligospora]KAF3135808.1 hypothetical protein TWF703_005903 [Orbilia oligospora]
MALARRTLQGFGFSTKLSLEKSMSRKVFFTKGPGSSMWVALSSATATLEGVGTTFSAWKGYSGSFIKFYHSE